jgi:adenylate cyclase
VVDPAEILKARLLVVDDQEANVLLLERALDGAGYLSVESTRDPRTVCELHRKNRYDLILLDLQMPVMDGFEVMEGLKQIEGDGYMPVLVITAQPDHKLRALHAGAKDFVSKPFDLAEVLMRVRNMLEVRLYAKALAETVQALGASRDLVRVQNGEIKKLFDEVVAERKLSERRALHVPPDSIAARLPARPEVTEDAFSGVTALIADVVGFAGLETAVGAAKLEQIFALFDGLAVERGLKKIKTLGNSYLAAAGVPVASADHAAQAAHLALDMVETLDRFNQRSPATLQVRIGLATGDVSAAVIGRRLFLYDAWGDAVDVASRMESHGVAGRVQVSESTRRLLGEPFQLEERGTLEVAGMGEVRTWFLLGRSGAAA